MDLPLLSNWHGLELASWLKDAYHVNRILWDGKDDDIEASLRDGEYDNNPNHLKLFGLGVFSVIGGIFYLLWRFLKDSTISMSLQVKAGINDAFLSEKSQFNTGDQRSTAAKVAGILGALLGVVLQVAIYALAILGLSRYGYHHLARAIR